MTKKFYQYLALLILSIFIVSCSSNEKLSEASSSSSSSKKNILNEETNKKSENNKKIKISEINNLILGNWLGTLKINEKQSLKLTLTVLSENGKLKALLGSPDQMAMGMKADFIEYKDYKVSIKLSKLNVEFNGKLKNNIIKGIFKQNGASFPLELSKVKSLDSLKKVYKQTPKKPYPYIEEEIIFLNKKANIELAGTLTYPTDLKKNNKKIPAIIMIAGSGPNDRNETPMGHFLYIADKLTKEGYAVLRFDKRGIKKSKGDYKKATSYDFAEDVFYAVDYLLTKDFIDTKKIGLFGHSEGGMIAPVVNTMRKDISFMILMGAPGVKGVNVLLKQSRDISRVAGVKDEEIKESEEKNKKIYNLLMKASKIDENLKKELLKISPEIEKSYSTLSSKWFIEFLKFEPKKYLEKLTIPTLVLSGEKDLQVDAVTNNKAIELALKKANNKNYKIITFKSLNHLFQTAKTGNPNEYGKLDEIMNEKVMQELTSWLKLLK